jgi:hypothetical protein
MANANETSPATASAHTPGPWNVYSRDGRTFIAAENPEPIGEDTSAYSRICDIPHCSDGRIPSCRMANARLIAAAPELLDMAKQYSSDCKTRIALLNDEIISGDDPDIDDLEDQIGHWTATKKQVDAVIAKVQGGRLR